MFEATSEISVQVKEATVIYKERLVVAKSNVWCIFEKKAIVTEFNNIKRPRRPQNLSLLKKKPFKRSTEVKSQSL